MVGRHPLALLKLSRGRRRRGWRLLFPIYSSGTQGWGVVLLPRTLILLVKDGRILILEKGDFASVPLG